MEEKRKKIGLAFGSGGFRGFALIGVIKTFIKHDIPIDYITGCSIGSFVGAHYSLYKDIDALEKYMFKYQSYLLLEIFGLNWKNIIKRKNIEHFLNRSLHDSKFENLQIPFQAVCTDLSSGDSVVIKKGNLAKAVRSSISIPFVLKSKKNDNKFLIDGAFSNPIPDKLVKDMGADIVVAVNLYKYTMDIEKAGRQRSLYCGLMILLSNFVKYSTNDADFIIEPDSSRIGMSVLNKYTSKKVGKELIAIGERETEKIIPELKKMMNKR